MRGSREPDHNQRHVPTRRGAPAEAIEHLRSAAPYERFNHLSIYLRGQAAALK